MCMHVKSIGYTLVPITFDMYFSLFFFSNELNYYFSYFILSHTWSVLMYVQPRPNPFEPPWPYRYLCKPWVSHPAPLHPFYIRLLEYLAHDQQEKTVAWLLLYMISYIHICWRGLFKKTSHINMVKQFIPREYTRPAPWLQLSKLSGLPSPLTI